MKKLFYPRKYYAKKEDIPVEEYYQQGYRGILFDIDNTLVPHDEPVDDAAMGFVEKLKKIGFRICLISNNDEERVRTFANPLGVEYVCKAWKPARQGYLMGMKRLQTGRENTLFVGDQIFTDIWGANRAGIYSILLEPINPKEEIQIILKRIPEKLVKRSYRKRKGLSRDEFD
ncbi:MAG: YqeG family HAD IIIA-type phosphatase [Bacteroidales bacterium]|nr:YqeG family HAD IIIA-type phosphatase [Clostridium sp.]MCM1202610.1 YqeG family HAD IIIA-type phosphatase [Bacteroidales bacterium]